MQSVSSRIWTRVAVTITITLRAPPHYVIGKQNFLTISLSLSESFSLTNTWQQLLLFQHCSLFLLTGRWFQFLFRFEFLINFFEVFFRMFSDTPIIMVAPQFSYLTYFQLLRQDADIISISFSKNLNGSLFPHLIHIYEFIKASHLNGM